MKLVDFLAHGDRLSNDDLHRVAPRRGWLLTRWLDRGAVGLSMLCLVHCLAFPVVVLALPTMGEILPRQWWVHPVIFALAVPMATIALVRGWSDHRDRRPVLLGGLGLALLGLGLLAAEASAAEVLLTVAGGMIVAAAHLLNWRLGRHGHAGT
ncbi:MerC domain-containing protein [Polymorphobacter megasporae]|uniref:MerC domain-containing protein n=1 Tax=Glacieibacterium megasporae TaxID=2835787 RepID=UPI001C1DDCC9|nr:MerC domain-containing protein [Polymorphobacter megasporae]UAJ12757.1 MerC domain-containing protein [Polymorphobacter megasporae]